MKRLRIAVTIAAALVLVSAQISRADTIWSTPMAVATDQGAVNGTALAMADDGTAIAVWTGGGGLGGARWDGQQWSAPTQLAAPGAMSPSVAMSDDGTSAVVAYDVGRQVMATTWDGQGWATAVTLGPASAYFTGPSALIDGDGSHAMVVWQQKAGNDFRVQASRLVGGTWSGPLDVIATGGQVPAPAAAMSDDGQVVVSIVVPDSSGPTVASMWWNGSAWTAPEMLTSAPATAVTPTPSVAISDDAGTAAGIWSVTTLDGSRVQAAIRTPTGWGAPEDLSVPGTQFGWPRIALSGDGEEAVAIWGPSNLSLTTNVQAATWSGGSWSSPRTLSTSSGAFPQAAITAQGQRAVAVWNATGGTVDAAWWADGAWKAATSMSDPALSSAAVKVALGTGDDVAALWKTTSGLIAAAVPARVPDAPTGVVATAEDARLTVAWTAPGRDGGRPITGYVATAAPGGAECTSTGLSCTVVGLTNGVGYTVTVRATNAVGMSAASVPSPVVTPAAPIVTPSASPEPAPSTIPTGPSPISTVITGWPRRLRTAGGKVRVRFSVYPALGRTALVQRKSRAWRTVRRLTLSSTESARVSVRLSPGRYRVTVPANSTATSATTATLRLVRRTG